MEKVDFQILISRVIHRCESMEYPTNPNVELKNEILSVYSHLEKS